MENVVMLSSVCGAHFHDDCQSCQSAKEDNDHRIHAARPTSDLGEDGELVEELLFAVRELNAVPNAERNEVASLTGVSFRAVADYTQRAADRIESLLATVNELKNKG